MPSPFPGMDPYLEGYLWPDVHNGLAFVIKELLVPQVVPKYIVHTEIYTVQDTAPEEDVGIMYPDVEVLKKPTRVNDPAATYGDKLVATPATYILPASTASIEVRIPVVKIKDRKDNQLITAIEILSPVNKRQPGLKPYRAKRKRLHQAGVNLLEIDLLHRGERPLQHRLLPISHYLISLIRVASSQTHLWTIGIQDELPVVNVPLKLEDEDTLLDLGQALQLLYNRSSYQYSINYQELPPPPHFSEAEQEWMKKRFDKAL